MGIWKQTTAEEGVTIGLVIVAEIGVVHVFLEQVMVRQ